MQAKKFNLVPEGRRAQGLLDTSVIIDLEKIDRVNLPIDIAVSVCALGLPLFTRNPEDFKALENLVEIVAV